MKDRHSLNIGFILFSLVSGGAERIILNLNDFFKHKGYKANVILIKNINDYQKEINYESKEINIISLLDSTSKISLLLYPLKIIQIVTKLLFLTRKNNYDLLIGGVDYYPYYLTVLVSKLAGIKNILIVHNTLSIDLDKSNLLSRLFHKILLCLSLRGTDLIISVSKGVAYDLEKKLNVPKQKIVTIYNGLNIKEINHFKKFSNSQSNKKHDFIVSFGRFDERKGHTQLIEYFKQINKILPKIKLLIIGKGVLYQKLTEQIADLKLKNKIILLGFVDNPYKYLYQAKLFIFPSFYEGFGNVIIEAMACGLPVISTDCPYGPREILFGHKITYPVKPISKITYCKYGILIPNGNKNALIKAVVTLLNNKKLLNRYKQKSLERTNDFTLEKMGGAYLKVINNLIASCK